MQVSRRNLKTKFSVWKVFCVHTTLEKYQTATITAQFGKLGREMTWLSRLLVFRKTPRPFSKYFPFTLKRKASVFEFLRFKERFISKKSVFGRPIFTSEVFPYWYGIYEFFWFYGSVQYCTQKTLNENVPINFQPQEDIKVNLILIQLQRVTKNRTHNHLLYSVIIYKSINN